MKSVGSVARRTRIATGARRRRDAAAPAGGDASVPHGHRMLSRGRGTLCAPPTVPFRKRNAGVLAGWPGGVPPPRSRAEPAIATIVGGSSLRPHFIATYRLCSHNVRISQPASVLTSPRLSIGIILTIRAGTPRRGPVLHSAVLQNYKIAFLRGPSVSSVPSVVNTRLPGNTGELILRGCGCAGS
jgi:hypothetical protein